MGVLLMNKLLSLLTFGVISFSMFNYSNNDLIVNNAIKCAVNEDNNVLVANNDNATYSTDYLYFLDDLSFLELGSIDISNGSYNASLNCSLDFSYLYYSFNGSNISLNYKIRFMNSCSLSSVSVGYVQYYGSLALDTDINSLNLIRKTNFIADCDYVSWEYLENDKYNVSYSLDMTFTTYFYNSSGEYIEVLSLLSIPELSFNLDLKQYNDSAFVSSGMRCFVNSFTIDFSNFFNRGYNTGYVDGYHDGQIDFDISTWLLNTVNNIMSIDILPNFSLFDLMLFVVGSMLVVYILKIFVGG